jgi:hypothetical protein
MLRKIPFTDTDKIKRNATDRRLIVLLFCCVPLIFANFALFEKFELIFQTKYSRMEYENDRRKRKRYCTDKQFGLHCHHPGILVMETDFRYSPREVRENYPLPMAEPGFFRGFAGNCEKYAKYTY